ncbi:ArsR/SmtB family transcription factor [Novosphingobium rosa]|jgi:ArsR family transcriptional regulator|uniref:ArsR/SmtB family transcription factor n=1 Tax=Novosphingobium rosa TaxID=76978 RepID=UPI00082FB9A1|nr:metalloregulator ArsR/SmtB family transcription factor [Novosphingobium rosa]
MKPTDLTELKANAAFMSQRLKAMSNAERLLMMCRMDEGEVSVNELVALTGLKQSAVSQHLGILRAEDVVEVRIDANVRWYRLKDPIVSGVIHALCDLCEVHGLQQPAAGAVAAADHS